MFKAALPAVKAPAKEITAPVAPEVIPKIAILPLAKHFHHIGINIRAKNIEDCTKKFIGEAQKILKKSCLLTSYLRGEGFLPTKCHKGEEKSGDQCFKKCKKGYSGAGPLCLQNCPPLYHDTGDFCHKPSPYSRGPGYLISQKHVCKIESPTRKCKRFGQLYYPTCQFGFHAVGCCVCAPNCDPEIGCHKNGFKKRFYVRGPGKMLVCPHGKQMHDGLCYPECKKGYSGVGPVCWGECPKHLTRCGFFCTKKGCLCTKKTDIVLRELGNFMISLMHHGFLPFGKLIVTKEMIIKTTWKNCKKNHIKKKICMKKIKALLKIIPGIKRGKKFMMPICHHKKMIGRPLIHPDRSVKLAEALPSTNQFAVRKR